MENDNNDPQDLTRPVAPAALHRQPNIHGYLLREYERADRAAAEAILHGWEAELHHARGRQYMAEDALRRLCDIDNPAALIPGLQAED
jgi:hypothetical protein